eukprot:scaffold241_cov340-Pavlova_lutheri.AAC.37
MAILQAHLPLHKTIELVHLLVKLVVQFHDRRIRHPLRQNHPGVIRHNVRVRSERKQVVAGLHRGETRTGDAHSTRPIESFDGAAHGGLQLIHLGGGVFPGIDGLFVLDQGQRQNAVVLFEDIFELGQVQPQVVRVEEPVLSDVLERIHVLGRTHGRFA